MSTSNWQFCNHHQYASLQSGIFMRVQIDSEDWLTCSSPDARVGLLAPCCLIVNLLYAGYRSSFGPSDGWEEEAQPRVVGQLAGGAGAGRERSDFYTKGAFVPGPAHSYPIVWPTANRGRVRMMPFGCFSGQLQSDKWLKVPETVTSFTIRSFSIWPSWSENALMSPPGL